MRAVHLAAAFAIALSAPAHAQIFGGGGGTTGGALEATQLRSWQRQADDMQRQYRQLREQYEATARLHGPGGIAGTLGGLGRMPGPRGADAPGLAVGRDAYGSAPAFVRQNRAYMPPDSDRWTEEMERRERTTANIQAIAYEGMADAEDAVLRLEAIQADIETVGTVVDAAAVNAQLAAFRQNLELNRARLDHLRVMFAAQERVEAQRAEQMQRESADAMIERTRPAAEAMGGAAGAATLRKGGW